MNHVSADSYACCRVPTEGPFHRARRVQEGYRIDTVDFQRERARVESLDVRSVPTFIFFVGGQEVRRASGYLTRDEIRRMFRSPDALF
ncbi:MAG: thioredoxin family protein [Pirellulaceae bacterium]